MKLITSAEVCEILGISKSTLYRWCNLPSEDYNEIIEKYRHFAAFRQIGINNNIPNFISNKSNDEVPNDFPRPFKIGRLLKWDEEEIKAWLESKRVT